MSLNSTPASERIHIGIFGRRNAGKSSVINALTGQDLAIVSEIKGTTTDPVSKAMELLPLGPVVIIDTPGLDDEGELGALRIKKSYQVLNRIDLALLVVDGTMGMTEADHSFVDRLKNKKLPYIVVFNKKDLAETRPEKQGTDSIWVSAQKKENIEGLKELIGKTLPGSDNGRRIVSDLIQPHDFIVLVVPIDSAAPKGRLILPQQQTIRDILEADAAAIVVKEHELKDTLAGLGRKPKLVITDSQVFDKVAAETPDDVMLTSFSILFSRYKGELESAVKSAAAIEQLQDGDRILIGEGCTHHRQCDDIGTVKLPRWITEYTKKQIQFEFVSGKEFPEDLTPYKLVVHCGGCVLNEREMRYRIQCAQDQGIPLTNYGTLIAYIKGILKRSVEIFPHIALQLDEE